MDDSFWLQLPDGELRHPYRLVKSVRAKYIRIKISKSGELSVVLPRGVSAKYAHRFIHEKSSWISKNLKKISGF